MTVPAAPPSTPKRTDDVSPLPFTQVMLSLLGDLAGIAFRRELLPDGTIRYPWISDNVNEILGVPASGMTVAARGALNVVHWADRDSRLNAIRESAASLSPCHEEFRAITACGETRWLQGESRPVRQSDGTVVWDGIWIDVTSWKRAEHRHQMLMDHAEDSILTLEANGGITWTNGATDQLFGYADGELVGRSLLDLIVAPAARDEDGATALAELEGLPAFARNSQEVTALRRDGSSFPFEMTVSEVRSDGQLSLIVIGRDITRRKATEMMLEETERRLGSIAVNLPGVVFQRILEPDGNVSYPYVSEGVADILGRDSSSIVENATILFTAMVSEDRRRLLAAMTESVQTLEPMREDIRVRDTGGRLRWLRGQSRPRHRDDSVVWDGLLLDVTEEMEERQKAEAAIRESEERLRITFAAASLGIVVVGLDGVIQYYNPAFKTMAASSDDELWGARFTSFVPHGQLPERDDLPPPGDSLCLTCTPTLKDGAVCHWRITGTQFTASPDADEPSILLFIEDVTETTRAAAERRQLELTLQEGQKLEALGRLAGGVAHELNNMLGPILMGAEMIGRTAPLDDKNRERVVRIIEASKNGRDIVRNVLAYCRKEQKSLAPLDLVPVVEQFISLATSVLPPSVKVEKHIVPAAVLVVADSGQLNQIFLNLANNARDAMNGVGTLSVTMEDIAPETLMQMVHPYAGRERNPGDSTANPFATLDPTSRHVEIRFADNGCGMTKAQVAKIFDPFFTTKPVGLGTGLGLSVVQGIIKAMNGVIAVETTAGEGSTFRIVLPIAHTGVL
jgi:PAS domain S-box-containing protein